MTRAIRHAAIMVLTLLTIVGFSTAAQAQFVDEIEFGHPSLVVGIVTTDPDDCTISAHLRNLNDFAVTVTLVTYRITEPTCAPVMGSLLLKSQMLYDYRTVEIPAAMDGGIYGVATGPVRLPECAAQWDIVRGPVIEQFIGSDFYEAFDPDFDINRVVLGGFTYMCKLLPLDGCITQEMLEACAPDICTATRGGYGQNPSGNNVGAFLEANWDSAFPQGLFIGAQAPGLSVKLSSPAQVREFLKTRNGTPGPLDSLRQGGTFASQVVTLTLNITFNPGYGGLVLGNTGTSLDGTTVAQILAIANAAIGGDASALPPGYDYSKLNDLVTSLNEAFLNCSPNSFANTYLFKPG